MTRFRRHLLCAAALVAAVDSAQCQPAPQAGYSLKILFDKLADPMGAIALDPAGSIYGAELSTNGNIYRLTPSGGSHYGYRLLAQLQNNSRVGIFPNGGVIENATGMLFGATFYNGGAQATGCGSVFTVPERGVFSGPAALYHPSIFQTSAPCGFYAVPTLGPDGALYGTSQGGNFGDIYRLLPPLAGHTAWRPEVLYQFLGQADGYYPEQTLLLDSAGVIFGTALASANGVNTDLVPIYKLSPPAAGQANWRFELIWRFSSQDCTVAVGKLVEDASGAIYGACSDNVTQIGDTPGTVFKLTPPAGGQTVWTETILWRFDGQPDGHPNTGVVMDTQGNLFGTTSQGNGTVFELSPPAAGGTAWAERTVWTFNGSPGASPSSPVVIGADGGLFGTTARGANGGYGLAYELVP